MILAPAIMYAEKDPKEAARKCLESVELDPESYRIGHTKARNIVPPKILNGFSMEKYIEYLVYTLKYKSCVSSHHLICIRTQLVVRSI